MVKTQLKQFIRIMAMVIARVISQIVQEKSLPVDPILQIRHLLVQLIVIVILHLLQFQVVQITKKPSIIQDKLLDHVEDIIKQLQ